MKIFDVIARLFGGSLKETVFNHVSVEAVEHVEGGLIPSPLVLADGTLCSLLDFDGSGVLRGEDPAIGAVDLEETIHALRLGLASHFAVNGHAMQFVFARDPGESGDVLDDALRRTRNVAGRLNLDISDILEERRSHLSRWVTRETSTIVLYSRPGVLSREEAQRGTADMSQVSSETPPARDAMRANPSHPTAVTRHITFVQSVIETMRLLNLSCEPLSPEDSVRRIRSSIYPSLASTIRMWSPRLHGEPKMTLDGRPPSKLRMAPTKPEAMRAEDFSTFFPPPLNRQIVTHGGVVLDSELVDLGDRTVGAFDMSLAPESLESFNRLILLMEDGSRSVPWRASLLIESGGLQAVAMKRMFVGVFAFAARTHNTRIRDAIDALRAIDGGEDNVVRLRMSFATWAPKGERRLAYERLNALRRAVERWGSCQTDALPGDPLACYMSSTPGVTVSTAPAVAAPLTDALALCPLNRPASPWRHVGGSMLLRSPDRRLWPYQPGSSLQETWVDILVGTPGSGKSVTLNVINLATLLSPQSAVSADGSMMLPKVAIIDIGPSSSGLISLVREGLPDHRKHEAVWQRLSMSESFAINPFDTQIGLRYPLSDERNFLINFLSLVCTPEGQTEPTEGVVGLIGHVIDIAYEQKDKSASAYVAGLSFEVDRALREHGVRGDAQTTWWEVVDELSRVGAWHEAALAQRYAVPVLADLMAAVQNERVADIYGEMRVGTSETLIKAFSRMISEAIRDLRIISTPTRFDLSTARVIALDLDEVTRGASPRVTALMFMLARNATTRDFFLQEDEIDAIHNLPSYYRDLHVKRARDNKEMPKRICYDELHRTRSDKGVMAGVRAQLLRDIREGRKHNIQISLASQFLGDFDKEMLGAATSVWICNARTQTARNEVRDVFKVNQVAMSAMEHRLTGPKATGAPVLGIFKLKTGDVVQLLVSTLGPIEIWAFSTTAEDVALRRNLTEEFGARRARQMLAFVFPGGTAKAEFDRRKLAIEESGGHADEASESLIVEMARDIHRRWKEDQLLRETALLQAASSSKPTAA